MARRTSQKRRNMEYSDRQRARMQDTKNKDSVRARQAVKERHESGYIVHGLMLYKCTHCCSTRWIYLELGVEDHGMNGKRHEPSPFFIRCTQCGELEMRDISGYLKVGDAPHPAFDGMSMFAYDYSSDDDACGIPGTIKNGIFVPDNPALAEVYVPADAGKE